MLHVSALYVYPIKSLGGIAVPKALVTDRGLQHDRRWMLVDGQGNFLSQRSLPEMALLQVQINETELFVQHKKTGASISIPILPQTDRQLRVTVWDNRNLAIQVSPDADRWFSDQLGLSCTLVYMPDAAPILVEPDYARNGEYTSFSDGYPFLLIGQSSLDDLNSRLAEPVPMNRFRPNIVVSGAPAYAEDGWHAFDIGTVRFFGVKPCGRCVVTTIDQETAIAGKDPLRTLASYRQQGKKILFGQNLLHQGSGTVQVGQAVHLSQ